MVTGIFQALALSFQPKLKHGNIYTVLHSYNRGLAKQPSQVKLLYEIVPHGMHLDKCILKC